jgi:hypothetical protein
MPNSDLEAEERMTHYGLRGRATNVFPVGEKRSSQMAWSLGKMREMPEGTGIDCTKYR